MTYGQMQALLAHMLGNMTLSSHPTWYPYIVPASNQEATSVIWQAANRYIELRTEGRPDLGAAKLFPELKTATVDQLTVATHNSFDRPTNAIAILKIFSADASAAPDWTVTRGRPMNPIDHEDFIVLDKTVPGYPTLYTREGDKVLYYPTTDADSVTYLHIVYLSQEPLLTSTSQSLLMSARRHDAVVKLAASIMASRMGRVARAQAWFNEAMAERESTIAAADMETPGHFEIEVEGAPTFTSVNGLDWGG